MNVSPRPIRSRRFGRRFSSSILSTASSHLAPCTIACVVLLAILGPASYAQTPPTIVDLSGDTQGNEGSTLRFSADVDDASGASLSYAWTFGDDTPLVRDTDLSAVSHQYADDGTYTLRLTVERADGASTSRELQVHVQNVAPDIERIVRTAGDAEDQTVRLRADVRDPGDDALTYTWHFGDGAAAVVGTERADVEHTYEESGAYEVTLEVDDGDGGAARHRRVVTAGVGFTAELDGEVQHQMIGPVGGSPSFVGEAGHECRFYLNFEGREGYQVAVSLDTPHLYAEERYAVGRTWVKDGKYYGKRRTPPGGGVGVRLTPPLPPGQQRHDPKTIYDGVSGTLTFTHFDNAFGTEEDRRIEGVLSATVQRYRHVEDDNPYALGPVELIPQGTVDVTLRFGTDDLLRAFQTSTCGEPVEDEEPLAVVAHRPQADAQNVDFENPSIQVDFSEELDPASVGAQTVWLQYLDPSGQPAVVPAALRTAGSRVTLLPDRDLKDGVEYAVHVKSGDSGVRSEDDATMERDYDWTFSTVVAQAAVEPHLFQTARDAPLVPNKPTLTRVYTTWPERSDVHPTAQVDRFVADVRVTDGSNRNLYPEQRVEIKRADRYNVFEKKEARNSTNFFGWEPSDRSTGTVEALVEPVDQEKNPPITYSGQRTAAYVPEGARARLKIEYYFMRYGPWEDGVPRFFRRQAEQISRQGALFTTQNFPVRETEAVYGGAVTVERPLAAYEFTRIENGQPVRIYQRPSGEAYVDNVLVQRLHDQVTASSDADMLLVFMPDTLQSSLGGYAYTNLRPRTIGLFLGGTGSQQVDKLTGTVAHEIGHVLGLPHASRCGDQWQLCVQRGLSDDVEGFRINLSGRSGFNKSAEEGNEEASMVPGSVLSLMHSGGLPVGLRFIMNDQYAEVIDAVGALTKREVSSQHVPLLASRTTAPVPPARTARVSGFMTTGGDTILTAPIARPDGARQTPTGGPFTIEVTDASGTALESVRFDTLQSTGAHAARPRDVRPFRVDIPFPERGTRLVIREDERVLYVRERNAPLPEVHITAPAADQTVGDQLPVRWSMTEERDSLHFSVHYRSAADRPWRPVALGLDRMEFILDGRSLPAGPSPALRVTATDGLAHTHDTVSLRPNETLRVLGTWPLDGDTTATLRPDLHVFFNDEIAADGLATPSDESNRQPREAEQQDDADGGPLRRFGRALREAVADDEEPTGDEEHGDAPSSVALYDGESDRIDAHFRFDPATRTLVLTPAEELEEATAYRVVVRQTLTTPLGHRLANDYTWRFRTPPRTSRE